MDLSKLTPWKMAGKWNCGGIEVWIVQDKDGKQIAEFNAREDAEKTVLMAAAENVMVRRVWRPVPRKADGSEWIAMNAFGVAIERGGNSGIYFISADPFSCLVSADQWMTSQGN